MTLERSLPGKRAKAVFFQDINDVDIFIEDTAKGSKKLYTELFSGALKGIYKISTVFPLGNKESVITDCEKSEKSGDRLRLYVVDGDLDLLNGRLPESLSRLYVLKRYCIENYLIDEHAIAAILHEEDLEKTPEDIIKELAFLDWLKKNETDLFELFVLYAIARKRGLGCVTVAFPVGRLVSSNEGIVDPTKVSARKAEVMEILLNHCSEAEIKAEKNIIYERAASCSDSKIHFISGKDYLFPLLLMRMRKITKLRAENTVIKQRLALKSDVTELKEVINYIS